MLRYELRYCQTKPGYKLCSCVITISYLRRLASIFHSQKNKTNRFGIITFAKSIFELTNFCLFKLSVRAVTILKIFAPRHSQDFIGAVGVMLIGIRCDKATKIRQKSFLLVHFL